MGLDMYLAKKNYVKRWDHQKPEEKYSVLVKRGEVVVGKIKPERVSYVIEQIAYWRKSNQIHQWFVENVQNGNDDCKDYWVSGKQLRDLVELCKLVLAASNLVDGKIRVGERFEGGEWAPIMVDGKTIEDADVAATLLPTSSGFFFGSQEYDEYYYRDLKYTVEQLEPELEADPDGDYEYHSSW